MARLAKRRQENLAPEDFLVRDRPDLFYRMEDLLFEYAREHFRAQILDTSDLEDESASERIIAQILAAAEIAATSAREND